MIKPEPDHLLLQLRGGVQRSQQLAPDGLVRELVAAIIESLALLFLVHAIGQGVDVLVSRIDIGEPAQRFGVRHLHAGDLCGDRRRQFLSPRRKLLLEEALAPEVAIERNTGAVDTKADAAQPQGILAP